MADPLRVSRVIDYEIIVRGLEVNNRTQAALLAHRHQLDGPSAATPGRS